MTLKYVHISALTSLANVREYSVCPTNPSNSPVYVNVSTILLTPTDIRFVDPDNILKSGDKLAFFAIVPSSFL